MLISIIIFLIASYIFGKIGITSTLSWSPSSDALSVILGLPVALAGSILAILLAERALSVSQRQEFQDNRKYIEEITDTVINVYWNICQSIRFYYISTSKVIDYYFRNFNTVDKKWNTEKNEDEFKTICLSLFEKQNSLIDSIFAIGQNSICVSIWKKYWSNNENGMTQKILSSLSEHAEPDMFIIDSFANISDFLNSVEIASSRSTQLTVLSTLNTYFSRESCIKYTENHFPDNENTLDESIRLGFHQIAGSVSYLDTFILCGKFLSEKHYSALYEDMFMTNKVCDEKYVNYGLAFLVDFVKSIPNLDKTREEINSHLLNYGINDFESKKVLYKLTELKNIAPMFPFWLYSVTEFIIEERSSVFYNTNYEEGQFDFDNWYMYKKVTGNF